MKKRTKIGLAVALGLFLAGCGGMTGPSAEEIKKAAELANVCTEAGGTWQQWTGGSGHINYNCLFTLDGEENRP